MKTFEICIEDSTYDFMNRELKKIRLIDDMKMSRNEFINLAIFGQCYELKLDRDNDSNNLSMWGRCNDE